MQTLAKLHCIKKKKEKSGARELTNVICITVNFNSYEFLNSKHT